MIKIDEKSCEELIYNVRDNDPKYKEALEKYQIALETNDSCEIDNAVCFLDATVCDIIYKKAFHDGMKFILDTLSGREVIEI